MGEWAGVQAIWLREFKVFQREKSRVVSSIITPIVWMFFFGAGLGGRVDLGLPGDITYTAYIFPGVLMLTVLFGSMFYGLYIVWDRKLDFLKEVLAAPISRSSVFFGKLVGGMTDALVQATLLLILGAVALPFLEPGFRGFNLLGLVLCLPVVFLIAASICALGLGIGSMFESFEGFQVISSFVTFPLFFLSGALYPLDGLPTYLAVLTHANPMTYAVDLLRTLLLGAGTFNPLLSGGVLIGFCAATVTFGVLMFQRMK